MTRGELSPSLVESFTAMAEAEMPALRRFAVGVCADPHRADDLVQAALERVYAAWPRLGGLEQPGAYLRTVLLRLALREQRLARWTRERSTAEAPEPDGAGGRDLAAEAAGHLDLVSLVRVLTLKQRAVVLLRYVEDRPVAEVAALLGVGEGTVKRQSSDALARLRQSVPSREPTTGRTS